MKIAIATKNENKVRELHELMGIDGVEFVSLKSLGFEGEIVENGSTFEENAMIKAKTVCEKYKLPTISDDSGLCVDALNGEPGIYSARYASTDEHNSSDLENTEKLLHGIEKIPEFERSARFVCAMAFCAPDGTQLTVKGICEGLITRECRGQSGFGYDPVFFCPKLSKTFGEATDEEKNTVSHRANAARQMSRELCEYIKKH